MTKGPVPMDELSEVCVMNIGPQQRLLRLRLGIAIFLVGAAITTALFVYHVAWPWRLALALPFAGAGMNYFQWREKT